MSKMAGPMENITVESMVWMELVPRSMMRSSSPVFRCRWKFRSMPSTWLKVSSVARLRGGGARGQNLGFTLDT